MDELDVKIFRSLIWKSAIAPTYADERTSLREIARSLGADDMTVRNRFRRMQESGALSTWQLVVNPSLFGFKILEILIDVQPESAKADVIRKMKLVHGVIVIVNFYGKSMKIILGYDSEKIKEISLVTDWLDQEIEKLLMKA